MQNKAIAIFGGSFNPPLNSHLELAKQITINLDYVEKVIFVPVSTKYHKSGLASDADRFNMFSDLLMFFTFEGGGMGTFGHSALSFDLPGSPDNDYIRIILAYGFPGSTLLALILLCSIKNGLKNIYENFFYLSCVGFMIIAATGAAVTEKYTLQSFVWWYAIGMIQTNTLGYKH